VDSIVAANGRSWTTSGCWPRSSETGVRRYDLPYRRCIRCRALPFGYRLHAECTRTSTPSVRTLQVLADASRHQVLQALTHQRKWCGKTPTPISGTARRRPRASRRRTPRGYRSAMVAHSPCEGSDRHRGPRTEPADRWCGTGVDLPLTQRAVRGGWLPPSGGRLRRR
jgi:hypothetical protein